MYYTLKNTQSQNLEEVLLEIKAGGTIRIYQFTISLILVTFSILSKPILVRVHEDPSKYSKKFNLISFIFGWPGIKGLPEVYDSYQINKNGGVDATEDIIKFLIDDTVEKEIRHDRIFIFPEDHHFVESDAN